eukprot:TRINITY_DN3364_c0_g1_i1.p1 TRINITY_DN3364_c0_g1~~TRINITY_DN3364_c0_g1_i1.p1  ORF type:complete len:447 (-),score=137.39 TRINITY_DN3364_c0_g1_i1:47-1387(-)
MLSSCSEVGDLKFDQIPGPEVLLSPGKEDGQNQLVKKDGKAWLYSWKADGNIWEQIGEVMDAKDKDKGKRTLNGKEYDYVFDVEIGDGGPMRQLGYNLGENPYIAAQNFILQNDLDQNFLEQVAKFIMTNVPESVGAKNVPAAASSSSTVPSTTNVPKPSSSSSSSINAPPSVSVNSNFFPQRKPLLFETGNFDQLSQKLKSLNQELVSSQNPVALTDKEISQIDLIVGKLRQTSHYHTSSFSSNEFQALQKLLGWPTDKCFVAIDLLRLMVLHQEGCNYIINQNTTLIPKVIQLGTNKENAHPSNSTLTFRFISNCFMFHSLRNDMKAYTPQMIDKLIDCYSGANNTLKIALSTALLNFSIMILGGGSDEEGAERTVSFLCDAISSETDQEVEFRLLVSMGNLFLSNKKYIAQANDLDFKDTLQKLSETSQDKVKQCANDLLKFF